MMDELKIVLLKKIFLFDDNAFKGANAAKFRADNYEHLDLIDDLENEGYIDKKDNFYYLRLIALEKIRSTLPEINDLLDNCEKVFQVLHEHYRKNPNQPFKNNNLIKLVDKTREEINLCLFYFLQAGILGSYKTDVSADDAYVNPSERILRYKNFQQIIEKRKKSSLGKIAINNSQNYSFFCLQDQDYKFLNTLLHPEIKKHSLKQFLDGHLRDSVLNSIIAVFDMIRDKTKLDDDGDRLIGKVFSLDNPCLVFSELSTESGRSEQKGFMQILKGAYQGIRSPKAHSLLSDLTKEKAVEYLVFSSLLARRVDGCSIYKNDNI